MSANQFHTGQTYGSPITIDAAGAATTTAANAAGTTYDGGAAGLLALGCQLTVVARAAHRRL